jgi:hypothetical protein
MEKPRVVAIYGSNLVMSAIGTSLRGDERFQVHHFDQGLPDKSGMPDGSKPHVILFDLATAPADLALSLLQKHPMLTMIGVDIRNNKMLVLSGEQSRLLTAEDLIAAIDGGAPDSPEM